MNEQTIKGKWNELKGEIMNTWGKLTDDEVDRAKGNFQSLSGIIQQKYGTAKDQISDELKRMFNRYGESINDKAEDVKVDLKNSEPGRLQ